MTEFRHFDWSPTELYEPIWIDSYVCVCLEGIPHPRDSFVIRLRQSKVFGTGGHPATRAIALKLLNKQLDEGLRVIDFKSGTGLLGIICSMFGCDVLHIDSDKDAVIEAIENGALNETIVSIEKSKQIKHITEADPCDLLVTSQSSVKLFREEMPTIHALMKSGGTFMLAGHKPSEHRAVMNILREFFDIEDVEDLQNWPVITARK